MWVNLMQPGDRAAAAGVTSVTPGLRTAGGPHHLPVHLSDPPLEEAELAQGDQQDGRHPDQRGQEAAC